MKRLFSILTIVSLCLTTWAVPGDTCKIRITRTEEGFDISAVSSNVFVRQGNSSDPKNYVYLTDTLVEIMCDDSCRVTINNANQPPTVTCWYQNEGGIPIIPINDRQRSHTLASASLKRKNWLEFDKMDELKDVDISIRCYDGSKEVKEDINFRKCYGWTTDKVYVMYQIEKESERKDTFQLQNDTLKIPSIQLKADGKMSRLSLCRDKYAYMMVNSVLLDGKEIHYSIRYDHDSLSTDDIMFATEIIADSLLNKQLRGGPHELSYECTVLSEDGPKEITLYVPIEVEQEALGISTINIDSIIKNIDPKVIIAGICIGIVIVLFVSFFVRKRKRKPVPKPTPLIGSVGGGQGDGVNTEGGEENKSGNSKEEEQQGSSASESDITETVQSAIIKWNERHPENKVDDDHPMDIDKFLSTVAKGYIYPQGKVILERRFQEYGVEYEELISATAINNLLNKLYVKGAEDMRGKLRELAERNAKLEELHKKDEKEIAELQSKHDKLQKDYDTLKNSKTKLQGDYDTLIDVNDKLSQTAEKQREQITELKKQVDAQSQENVAKLEGQIKQLGEVIIYTKEMIAQKDREISDGQEKIKKLTIQKANWETKYNETKKTLDEVGDKHQEELDRMKNDHKVAILVQKEKYEQRLKEKEEEMTDKRIEFEADLEEQKMEYEGKLANQKKEFDAIQLKMDDEHEKAIGKLNKVHAEEVDRLKATIQELGTNANMGRELIIAKSEELLKVIGDDLAKVENSVKAVANQAPIFVNVIKKILIELQITCEDFTVLKNEEWSAPDRSQKQVIADMQKIYIEALGRSGWMNNVARLLSYSRLPVLHDGTDLPAALEAHGISPALFERIYANMVNLLGVADMGILVPAVLANNFDKESYDFKNSDIWIDKFFPEVSIWNYKGKVFDIVQVGYTIGGVTEQKPIVQYN